MTTPDPTQKIYLTYKTRMLSEALTLGHAKFVNALMAWYSFLLIIFSVSGGLGYFSTIDVGLISISASVGIFGLSLYLTGQKLWQRPMQFKECYLKLKSLYESSKDPSEKMESYTEILNSYENQTDEHFDEMVVDAWMRGQVLFDSRGKISPTKYLIAHVIFLKAWRAASRAALVVAPLLLLLLPASENLHLGESPHAENAQ